MGESVEEKIAVIEFPSECPEFTFPSRVRDSEAKLREIDGSARRLVYRWAGARKQLEEDRQKRHAARDRAIEAAAGVELAEAEHIRKRQ